MRYRIYHSIGSNRHVLYHPEDPLWLDPTIYTVTIPYGKLDRFPAAIALDYIYETHTFDSRPDATVAPPIAVGDVIAVETSPDAIVIVAVTDEGFVPVDEPSVDYLVPGATFAEAEGR